VQLQDNAHEYDEAVEGEDCLGVDIDWPLVKNIRLYFPVNEEVVDESKGQIEQEGCPVNGGKVQPHFPAAETDLVLQGKDVLVAGVSEHEMADVCEDVVIFANEEHLSVPLSFIKDECTNEQGNDTCQAEN